MAAILQKKPVALLALTLAFNAYIAATQPFYVQCDRTTDRGSCANTDLATCNGQIMRVTPQDITTITTFPICVRPAETFTLALSGPIAIIHANKGSGVSTPPVNDGNCGNGVLFDSFGQFTSVELTAPLGETTMEILLIQTTGFLRFMGRQFGTVQVTSACPTPAPTLEPTPEPTTPEPTNSPTTPLPSASPTTPIPSVSPSPAPTGSPVTPQPTESPTTPEPTSSPSPRPTQGPVSPTEFFEDPGNVAAVAGGAAAGVAFAGAAAGYFIFSRSFGARGMSGEMKNIDAVA